MAEVGSDDWIAALAETLGVLDPGDIRLVVQHELTDAGRAWYVSVRNGRVHVSAGRHPSPDVTFTEDAATAADVSRGEVSALAAFTAGRLRVRGDVGRLREVADLFARVHAGNPPRTT